MNTLYNRTNSKIYNSIGLNNKIPHLVGVLYLFVRGLDKVGCGNATLDLAELATTLKRSVSTIKTNLRLARRLGVFRLASLTGLTARVSYLSLTKLCVKFDIKKLGAAYEINAEDFQYMRSLNIRFAIAHKQSQSIYAATVAAKKAKKPPIILPSEIFDGASAECQGVTVVKGRVRNVLFTDARFTSYGASQESIAEEVGRSRQTILNHLKAKDGLEAVRRFQVLKLSEDDVTSPEFWKRHSIHEYHQYCDYKGSLYKRCPNIYDLDRDFLIPDRTIRAKVMEAHGEIEINWKDRFNRSTKKRASINK